LQKEYTYMPQILVIADDFTGAAEIGGISHLFGLSVKVLSDQIRSENYREEVLVIDTNTRRLSPEAAFQKISAILTGIDLSFFDLIYKKVDSVIRGPIESEIMAILSATGFTKAVLMPANPSRGRTIRDGMYFIDNIPISNTDFIHDPEYPRTSDEVADLIVDATKNLYVGEPGTADEIHKIIVPDVSSQEHFRSVIKLFSDKKYLPAGGADFFRSLLQDRMKLSETKKYAYTYTTGRRHFIIGSKSLQSNLTIQNLQKSGFSDFYLPESALKNEGVFSGWLEQVFMSMQDKKNIFIARPDTHISDPGSINRIIFLLAKTASELISLSSPEDELIIEGGETASTIIRNLENPDLVIEEVIADGVVKLEIVDKGIYLIVKPGSYRWSKNFLNTLNQ